MYARPTSGKTVDLQAADGRRERACITHSLFPMDRETNRVAQSGSFVSVRAIGASAKKYHWAF